MSREQYIKIIERELHNINKRIDMKILQGLEYKREAMEHKLLQKKIRQHARSSFFSKLFQHIPQIAIF